MLILPAIAGVLTGLALVGRLPTARLILLAFVVFAIVLVLEAFLLWPGSYGTTQGVGPMP